MRENMQNTDPQFDLRRAGNLGASRTKVVAIIAAGSVAIGAGAVFLGRANSSADTEPKDVVISTVDINKDCSDISFDNSASDASAYESDAFLPKTGPISTQLDVEKYINSLFGKKGPLANNADEESLATVVSAVVKPATDGEATNPNYDYSTEQHKAEAAYSNTNGVGVAAKDCVTAYDTLYQIAGFTDNWVGKGRTVIELAASRDKHNDVVDIDPHKLVTKTTLQGILLSFNNQTTKGLNDFNEVLIATNPGLEGDLFVKGSTTGVSGKPTPNTSGITMPSQAEQNQNGSNGRLTNNGGGGHVSNGNTREQNTGPLSGPNNEALPAPGENTPGGGGNKTGNSTPTPTTGPKPPETTTVPATTPTTEATTSTTTPTKGTGKIGG